MSPSLVFPFSGSTLQRLLPHQTAPPAFQANPSIRVAEGAIQSVCSTPGSRCRLGDRQDAAHRGRREEEPGPGSDSFRYVDRRCLGLESRSAATLYCQNLKLCRWRGREVGSSSIATFGTTRTCLTPRPCWLDLATSRGLCRVYGCLIALLTKTAIPPSSDVDAISSPTASTPFSSY